MFLKSDNNFAISQNKENIVNDDNSKETRQLVLTKYPQNIHYFIYT